MIGTTLVNRYRIDAEVSRGGMGIVYHAQDMLLHRAVAVKILLSASLGAANKARLLREAQAAARLNHSNIVAVHDAGEADGAPFIVMELVEGESLRHHPLQTLTEILSVARQVCAALEHAHAHGVIHRDLKPENILVMPPAPTAGPAHETKVKLTDFGLAHSVDAPRITDDDSIVGTFTYLAPEVLQGQPASAQSDLYALGVMLYELTTGQPPFMGESIMAVIAQHLNASITLPSAFNAEISPQLDSLIVRLLSKKPEDRPASAREVGLSLERLLTQGTGPLASDLETVNLPPPPDLPKLLLVDDDAFNREGVRLFLARAGFQVLEAGDEETAWQLAQNQTLAVAVVDISLPPNPNTLPRPNLNFGVRLAGRLKEAYPALGVVLFSAHEDRGAEVMKLIQAGHRGLAYKLKGTQPKALLSAVQDVRAGRVVLDPEVSFNRRGQTADLLQHLSPEERPWVERALANLTELTAREQEVAQRLAASHTTEGIAQALNVTGKTVENYITRVYDKLGLNEMHSAAPHLRQVVIIAKAYMIKDFQSGAPT